jgi:hypothetical protein
VTARLFWAYPGPAARRTRSRSRHWRRACSPCSATPTTRPTATTPGSPSVMHQATGSAKCSPRPGLRGWSNTTRMTSPTGPGHYAGYRQFFIGCHDASGEFLADDLTAEITQNSHAAALQEAAKRTGGMSTRWWADSGTSARPAQSVRGDAHEKSGKLRGTPADIRTAMRDLEEGMARPGSGPIERV